MSDTRPSGDSLRLDETIEQRSTTDVNQVGEPIDRLAEEFAQRYRNGEAPSIAEYEARHPELAASFAECSRRSRSSSG